MAGRFPAIFSRRHPEIQILARLLVSYVFEVPSVFWSSAPRSHFPLSRGFSSSCPTTSSFIPEMGHPLMSPSGQFFESELPFKIFSMLCLCRLTLMFFFRNERRISCLLQVPFSWSNREGRTSKERCYQEAQDFWERAIFGDEEDEEGHPSSAPRGCNED